MSDGDLLFLSIGRSFRRGKGRRLVGRRREDRLPDLADTPDRGVDDHDRERGPNDAGIFDRDRADRGDAFRPVARLVEITIGERPKRLQPTGQEVFGPDQFGVGERRAGA